MLKIFFSAVLIVLFSQSMLMAETNNMDSTDWKLYHNKEVVTLNVHWYISRPFIYPDENGEITGLEYDILLKFQSYVKEKHGIDLKFNWNETESFSDILQQMKLKKAGNSIGVSAFSITAEREDIVDFSDPYMADFTVLVSSSGTPIYKTFEDAKIAFNSMDAITIKGTTYESFLIEMQQQLQADYDIIYINSDRNILDAISNSSNRFGFIDLPIYLMLMKNGGGLTRQNFFTKKGEGYAYVFNEESIWRDLMNDFLSDSEMKIVISEIVSQYMGEGLYQFINTIYGGQNIGTILLTKEKEMQLEQLQANRMLLAKERQYKLTLIICIGFLILLVVIIYVQYLRKQNVSKVLKSQNDQIAEQQLSIKQKNEKLYIRNFQLTSLNEEKNNLVKILAHDLRTPINHITGLLDVLTLSSKDLVEADQLLVKQVKDASERVNKMISKILDFDALEGDTMKIMIESINLAELLEKLQSEFSSQLSSKQIELILNSEENLVLSSDYLFLTQTLENLLSNAIKFSSNNTKIMINAYSKGDQVFIEVEDQGPGLTDEDKTLIFNKYQKLSAKPTNGEPSTGLGLSIVKKYVKLLNGSITFETTLGIGTKFIISLPIKKED